jgi:hypothetical protein
MLNFPLRAGATCSFASISISPALVKWTQNPIRAAKGFQHYCSSAPAAIARWWWFPGTFVAENAQGIAQGLVLALEFGLFARARARFAGV